MTDVEVKILFHLNKVRGQNNVDQILSEMLSITDYDLKTALSSLLDKNYIYEDSDTNQKNLNLKAWRITKDGEIKANEIQAKLDFEKEQKVKQDIKTNAKSTQLVAWATFAATFVGAVAVVFQAFYANRQNQLLEKQNSIQKGYTIESPIAEQNTFSDSTNLINAMNIVAELKIVKDKMKLIDSSSKGQRHITLVPMLDDPTNNVYLVKVGEDNGTNLVTYFNFLVDVNSKRIINPDGKLEGQ